MEADYPGFVMGGFLGLAVPAGTPETVLLRLNALSNGAITSEPMRSRLLEFGFTPDPIDLAACAALMRRETARWAGFVRTAGIEPE